MRKLVLNLKIMLFDFLIDIIPFSKVQLPLVSSILNDEKHLRNNVYMMSRYKEKFSKQIDSIKNQNIFLVQRNILLVTLMTGSYLLYFIPYWIKTHENINIILSKISMFFIVILSLAFILLAIFYFEYPNHVSRFIERNDKLLRFIESIQASITKQKEEAPNNKKASDGSKFIKSVFFSNEKELIDINAKLKIEEFKSYAKIESNDIIPIKLSVNVDEYGYFFYILDYFKIIRLEDSKGYKTFLSEKINIFFANNKYEEHIGTKSFIKKINDRISQNKKIELLEKVYASKNTKIPKMEIDTKYFNGEIPIQCNPKFFLDFLLHISPAFFQSFDQSVILKFIYSTFRPIDSPKNKISDLATIFREFNSLRIQIDSKKSKN